MKKSKLPKGADDANDAALWQAAMSMPGSDKADGALQLTLILTLTLILDLSDGDPNIQTYHQVAPMPPALQHIKRWRWLYKVVRRGKVSNGSLGRFKRSSVLSGGTHIEARCPCAGGFVMQDLPPGPPPAVHVPNPKRDKPKRPGGAAPKGWSKEPIPDGGAGLDELLAGFALLSVPSRTLANSFSCALTTELHYCMFWCCCIDLNYFAAEFFSQCVELCAACFVCRRMWQTSQSCDLLTAQARY